MGIVNVQVTVWDPDAVQADDGRNPTVNSFPGRVGFAEDDAVASHGHDLYCDAGCPEQVIDVSGRSRRKRYGAACGVNIFRP